MFNQKQVVITSLSTILLLSSNIVNAKIKNNYEYYKAFGAFFIASKVRENLEDIIEELEKVKDVAKSINK